MTDVFDVVRDANPIKDVDRYAEVVAGLDAQLHGISWRDQMIDDKPRVVSSEDAPVEHRSRRWWLAAAAVVVVLVIGGLGYALISDETSEVADVPAPTTLPTQAPVTTAAEATMTPLETVELFLERWVSSDVEQADLLVSPTATARCYECLDVNIKPWVEHKYRGIDIRTMALARASGAGVGYACTTEGEVVTCTLQFDTLLAANGEAGPEWVSHFTAEDGVISFIDAGFYPDVFNAGLIADYADWLETNHPEAYEDLVYFGTLLVNDLEQINAHRGLIAEWAAGR
ncbi:MAG: hypothetical protein QNJ81_00210 [Acidimicrobiia bacterium]|nr:hypothetical protein [Acidimicrobiia bacterium]